MILVSGGTGFVGSGVVRELMRRRTGVAVLSREPSRVADRFPGRTVEGPEVAPSAASLSGVVVEARQGDVRDPDSLRRAFEGAHTVIDCVQFPNSPIENRRKGWTFEEIDYHGTLNQVQAAADTGVNRFVYVSGVGAARDADKHWFRFKWLAEEAVRHSGIPYVIIRPTWVYGPDDVALNRFIDFARRLSFVPLFGDGKQLMQPIFVDDVARLLAESVDAKEAESGTFEAGGPEVMSMDEVITTALDVAGIRRPILHQPVWLGKALASLLQFLPGPPLTPDVIDFITHNATADNSALGRVFGRRLTPLREGLRSYLEHEESNGVEA